MAEKGHPLEQSHQGQGQQTNLPYHDQGVFPSLHERTAVGSDGNALMFSILTQMINFNLANLRTV